MKGYSFKIDGRFTNFAEDREDLERRLEAMGYTNYKKAGIDNFVDANRVGSSPHWGRDDKYGEVIEVSLIEGPVGGDVADVASELEEFESVAFEKPQDGTVKVTLSRAEDAGVNPGWAISSVLLVDGCDTDRLVGAIRQLRESMASL